MMGAVRTDGKAFPRPSQAAYCWAVGGTVAGLGLLRLSNAGNWPGIAPVMLGALIAGITSSLLYLRQRGGRSRSVPVALYSALWLVATGLVLLLRPWLAEIHDYYGLLLGAALAGALLGMGSAFFVAVDRLGSAAERWVLQPLLAGVLWAIILAVALQMAILVWYLFGDLLLEPLLGPEIGFPLSALVGGAAGGGFAGYLCGLVLGLSAEVPSSRPE